VTDPDALRDAAADAACVMIAQPNFFGCLEDAPALTAIANDAGAVSVVHVDPMTLGLLEAPGAYGAQICIGEGQSAGNPLAYGGPHYGFMASTMAHVRRLPGRIVGQTTDTRGRRGFVLTLQTREQHIRREKATSNITTNQTLLALCGLAYLSWLGPEGLREVGQSCLSLATYARDAIGLEPVFDHPIVKEFAVRTNRPAVEVIADARKLGVHPGHALGNEYRGMDDVLLVAVTERRTRADIDRLASVLAEVGA
jgi:glycine dehydrogenase subunit 1